jgi:hypothetical protein
LIENRNRPRAACPVIARNEAIPLAGSQPQRGERMVANTPPQPYRPVGAEVFSKMDNGERNAQELGRTREDIGAGG